MITGFNTRVRFMIFSLCGAALMLTFPFAAFARVTLDLPYDNISVAQQGARAVFSSDRLGGEPGWPALPVYKYTVLLPPDADLDSVQCSIEGYVETEVDGKYDVSPVEPPRNIEGAESWPRGRTIADGKDVSVYGVNGIFPRNPVSVKDIGQMNCFKLVTVEVNKFRYNPATKSLFEMQFGRLAVDYGIDPTYEDTRVPNAKVPRDTKARLQKMVANYGEFIARYEKDYTFTKSQVLAILIAEADKSQLTKLDAFVAAKQQVGFDVQVVTDSDWGGGTGSTAYTNIRTWLQGNLQKQGLNYALFIGASDPDSSAVPMLYFPGYANWGMGAEHDDCETDWGYAQLTGEYKDDYIPELHVGRIPIYDNYSQIDEILQKTIDYFSTPEEQGTWRYNALLGGPGYNSGDQTSWTTLNPAYHEYIEPMTDPPWTGYRAYSGMYETPVEADEVTDDMSGPWSQGTYSVISWGAHGASELAQGAMTSSATTSVGNDHPGFVMCGSCSNAEITDPDNLSYSILKNCGVGAIGGTDYTVISDDQIWIKAFVGYLVKDKLTNGEAMTQMLMNDCQTDWLNRGPYVLHGDPSIGVYSFAGGDDGESPVASIDSPSDGDTFDEGATIAVTATATDNVAVTQVELFADGASQGIDEQAPYEWSLGLDNGEHTLHVTATDPTGNTGDSDEVKITVGSSDDDDDNDDNDDNNDNDNDDNDNDDDNDSGDDDDDDDDDSGDDDDDNNDDNDNDDNHASEDSGCGCATAGGPTGSPLFSFFIP